jgi:hypothetical protein
MLDLDSFLVSLYVLVDDWWKASHPPNAPRKHGRPALLCESEVLTLAILAQWPRFRSERDFWRFASSHLRPYFPALCSQSQLNRRIRALEPEMRLLQRAFAEDLTEPSALYRVMDTTLVPAIVRVRASRKGLFCGQASFGRSASKTEWVYGFKVALVVDSDGVITAFGLAPAASDERPIASRGPHSLRPSRCLPGRQGLHGHRVGTTLDGDLRGVGCSHTVRQLPQGMVEGRSALGVGQTPDHRRGDLPTEGLLLSGEPPSEDPSGAASSPGGQGRGLHLRPTAQPFPGSTATSTGRPLAVAHCTSVV